MTAQNKPDSEDRLVELGTLKDLQAQGKIRHIGLSEVNVAQIEHARTIVAIATVQNRYSVADRGAEDVLEYCEGENIGFIPWFPLGSGTTEDHDFPVGSGVALVALAGYSSDSRNLEGKASRTERCRWIA